MKGYMVLRTNDCVVAVSDNAVRVERAESPTVGCVVLPKEALCSVWAHNREKILPFSNAPAFGIAEAFAIDQNGFTLKLYRWKTGSYVLEVWHNNVFVSAIEWSRVGWSGMAYFEGDEKGFLLFAEATLKTNEGSDEQ